MEAFGIEKRELLADRVRDARDAQQEAGEEFKSTLDAFKAVTGFDGGSLESAYRKLDGRYESSEAAAAEVSERIAAIESVAGDLFSEWKQEAREYADPDLRRRSEELREETQERCDELVGAMKQSEKRMQPVLKAFHDQVLFLKHNLNAQAVGSLQGNVAAIEQDVSKLIAEMEASIAEADAFIRTLE
jgi:hypothetical protein